MKKLRLGMAGILIAGLVFSAGVLTLEGCGKSHEHKAGDIYYCPMHPFYTSDKPGTCPICSMTLVKKEAGEKTAASPEHAEHSSEPPKEITLQEFLAMKPGQICLFHKCKMGRCVFEVNEKMARLGKCPHCGEDLGVVIKGLMPEGYSKIKVDPAKQQAIGVKTGLVEKKAVTKTLRTVGRIAYDPELYQTEQEYLEGLKAYQKTEAASPEIREQAEKLVESSRIKLRLLGLNADLIKELEEAGKPDRSLLYTDSGEKAWLYAPIYEYEIPLVKAGAPVSVEVSAVPGREFKGTVRAIDSVLDPATRSARVRVVLENTEGLLKPEMYANASLQIDLGENVVVPEEAVFQTGEKNIVFVSGGDELVPREVTLGAKADHVYIVTAGLEAGESVVTSGNFLIDSESRLKATLEGAGQSGGHQHGA